MNIERGGPAGPPFFVSVFSARRRKASILREHVGAHGAVLELVVEPGILDELDLLARRPSAVSSISRDCGDVDILVEVAVEQQHRRT